MFNGIHHLAFITNDLNKTIRVFRNRPGFHSWPARSLPNSPWKVASPGPASGPK